jgi:predicted permease
MQGGAMNWHDFVRERVGEITGDVSRDADIIEELAQHLSTRFDELVGNGVTEQQALDLVVAELRNGGDLRRAIRKADRARPAAPVLPPAHSAGLLRDIGHDLRYAVRMLRHSRGFALVAILTLALGMGANAAVYQLVEAVLLRPLPVKDPQQLVTVALADTSRRVGRQGTQFPALTNTVWEHLRENHAALDDVMAWSPSPLQLGEEVTAGTARGLFVSGEFFKVLGVMPHLGRVFMLSDDHRACGTPGAVVSYGFWQRWFGGDPTVIGKTIGLNGHPVEVIGVTPPGFFGVEVGREYDVAVPLCSHAVLGQERNWLENGLTWWVTVMGRMKPDQSPEQVNAGLQASSPSIFEATLPPGIQPEDAQDYRTLTLRATPAVTGLSLVRDRYGSPLVILLITTGLVLLIACTNLANLALARTSAREQEFSLRLAIGASWSRLVRQLMVENALLTTVGALAGLALGGILSRSLIGFLDPALSLDLRVDIRMIGFMVLASTLTCLTFGLIPAWRASRVAAAEAMKAGARTVAGRHGGAWTRRMLVIAQVALSLVLAFGALLFAATLRNLLAVDMGFQTADVLLVRINSSRLSVLPGARSAFKRDLLDRVRTIPGIKEAAEVRHVPMSGTGTTMEFWRDGDDPAMRQGLRVNRVTDDYFRLMSIRLMAGRPFTPDESMTSARVAIVNPSFLSAFNLGGNPIGKTLRAGDPLNPETYEIVGLIPDTKYLSLREQARPIVFLPVDPVGDSRPFTDLVVRSVLPPGQLRAAIRQGVAGKSPLLGVDVQAYDDTIRRQIGPERLMGVLSAFFGGLSLLVAAIGLYGVMSYLVAQRTNEIGVRVALGAGRGHVVGLVLREATFLSGTGLALGSAIALAGANLVRSLVFGVGPRDVLPIVLSCMLLGAVAVLASLVPAWRASRVEPLIALRRQ